jgi:hypothetical protein
MIVIFIVLLIFNFIRIDSNSHSVSDTLRPFIFQTALLVIILFFTLYLINKKKNKTHNQ